MEHFAYELWKRYILSSSPDMPKSFVTATFLTWVSTLVGPRIIFRDVPGELTKYPCVWFILVGPPGSFKSSAIRLLIRALPPDREPPSSLSLHGSPEGLLQILSGLERGEGVLLHRDEFVAILRSSRKDSYASAWRELLLELYAPYTPITRTLRKETIRVTDAFTPFIGSITPQNLLEYGGMEEVRTGFLTRFLPVLPSPVEKVEEVSPSTEEYRKMLLSLADDLCNHYRYPSSIYLLPEAMEPMQEFLADWQKKVEREPEEELQAWLRRTGELLPKASALFCASDFRFQISIDDIELAKEMLHQVEQGVRKVYNQLSASVERVSAHAELLRLLRWLAPRGSAKRSEIYRKFRWGTRMMREIEELAKDMGYIYIENGKIDGRGHPTQEWKLLSLPPEILEEGGDVN